MKTYKCSHCGWLFSAAAKVGNGGLVPSHGDGGDPKTLRECPGSNQAPRNAEADRRPLWKDGGVQ